MSKNYIGSQQHWEDSVNDDHDVRESRDRQQSQQQPEQENPFLSWYDTFLDAMRNGHKYKGAIDMEAAKTVFDTGKMSPTEYAEFLINS